MKQKAEMGWRKRLQDFCEAEVYRTRGIDNSQTSLEISYNLGPMHFGAMLQLGKAGRCVFPV